MRMASRPTSSGSVTAAEGFPEGGLGGLMGKAGTEAVIEDCASGEVTLDFGFEALDMPEPEKKDSYTATFLADGKVVAEISYRPGDTVLGEPEVPVKEGKLWNEL